MTRNISLVAQVELNSLRAELAFANCAASDAPPLSPFLSDDEALERIKAAEDRRTYLTDRIVEIED
jgi:hypothetical protein